MLSHLRGYWSRFFFGLASYCLPGPGSSKPNISYEMTQEPAVIHAKSKHTATEIRSGIPSERIVIGGFSMGGALALYAGFTYDKPLAGIIGLSSFLVQKSKVPGKHTANRDVHIFMGHGGADFVVPLTFGEMSAEFIRKFDPNIKLHVYPEMSHGSCDQVLFSTTTMPLLILFSPLSSFISRSFLVTLCNVPYASRLRRCESGTFRIHEAILW
ncbi:Acyl-protein thioesterase 1 [Toxocara canis]|uniref:palmitoyl-protein hydrolase n=1 Tax=Toxocara canis TaxID=6265 RepID=A0A0B2VRA0_TOXCA|nr:Acyl-protein thioesterase 1 [Toxocara canis]